MIKFRLADNLALDYSDFRDEGLRVAVFARSGSGKSNLAALFAEQALEGAEGDEDSEGGPDGD